MDFNNDFKGKEAGKLAKEIKEGFEIYLYFASVKFKKYYKQKGCRSSLFVQVKIWFIKLRIFPSKPNLSNSSKLRKPEGQELETKIV